MIDKTKIEALVEECESANDKMRDRWPETKDPEKYRMELVMFHLSQSCHALRSLLQAMK